MGGVTKVISNVGDAVGDVVEDVGDALGVGGGGGSGGSGRTFANAPPEVLEDARQRTAQNIMKGTGLGPKPTPANAAARAQVAEGVAAVRPKVDEVMQQVGITPQVVVYGPDGTVYSNPAAAEAAGVTNYTMTPPTFDRVNPLDPVAPGGFASPIDPGVIRPFQPGEGGFLGGTGPAGEATTGFPAQGRPPVNLGPNEVATTFALQRNQMEPARQFETPFQRPTGGQPVTPEQALIFARQAAQRPMQRFAAGGSVRPMQQGVGSLMNYIKRG